MDWDAIGAVGEVLGAIAVVITLLYLAQQTRKSGQSIDATSSRDAAHYISEWHREAARDPELSRIMLKSTSDDSLDYTDEEWWRFRAFAISLFVIYQSHFIHRSLDVGSAEEAEKYISFAQSLVNTFPAWKRYWHEEKGSFVQGFVDAVDGGVGEDYRKIATAHQIDETLRDEV